MNILPNLHRPTAYLLDQLHANFGFAWGSVAAALGPIVEQLLKLRAQAVDLQLAAGLLLQPAQLNQQSDARTVTIIHRGSVEIHRRRPRRRYQPSRFAPHASGAVGVESPVDGEFEQAVARAVAAQLGAIEDG